MVFINPKVILAGLFAVSIASVARPAITRKPYLQSVTTTSAVIMWESDQPTEGTVNYGADDKVGKSMKASAVKLLTTKAREAPEGESSPPAEPKPAIEAKALMPPNAHLYECVLQGFKPGEQVYYQVDDGTEKSAVKSFRTVPENAQKFEFVIYGDNRTQPRIHTLIGEQILNAKPDILLSTGDLVSRGPDYGQWTPQFFQPLENVIDHICVWPSIGNHEGDGINYRNVFHLPGDEMNYSFDYGTAHFAAIDTIGATPVQVAEWLEKDLAASKAKWKFVYGHIPTYNAGGHESKWGRTIITGVYRRQHVDIVFTGHSHLYERTHPIKSSYGDDWPVLYIVTGGGGAPLYDLDEASYIAKAVKNYHIVNVNLDGDKLSAKVINEKGEQIDEFAIDKTKGHTPEYLAEAQSEELTNFIDELHSSFKKNAPVAKAGEEAKVSFKIYNRNINGPVEATLRPEKSDYFEKIKPESITLTINSGEEKNAEFLFKPAMDLRSENKDYVEKVRQTAKQTSKGLAPVGLTRMSVEYKTPLGNGKLEAPTLLAGPKLSIRD